MQSAICFDTETRDIMSEHFVLKSNKIDMEDKSLQRYSGFSSTLLHLKESK